MIQTNLKDAVISHNKRAYQQYLESPLWLYSAIQFQAKDGLVYTVESPQHQHKFDQLYNKLDLSNRKETKFAFRQLVIALLKYSKLRKPLRISRNKNNWKKTTYNKIGTVIIKIMDAMKNQNYIDMKKGFYYEDNRAQTRIWATDKLLDEFETLSPAFGLAPFETIILKSKKDEKGNKELIDYKDTKFTNERRKKVKTINEVYKNATFQLGRFKLNPFLQSIFTEDFKHGGRLYTSGSKHHIQGLPADERQELIINGNEVIEADFSGLHPRLLYAKEGIQYTDDPYLAIANNKAQRKFLKQIFLSMINTSSVGLAINSANNWLYQFDEDGKPNPSYEHQILIKRLVESGIKQAGPLIKAFLNYHKPIKKYLCTDANNGLKLQYDDSTIALNILTNFAQKDISVLPVHDSFVVEKSYETDLMDVMDKVYKDYTNGFGCSLHTA